MRSMSSAHCSARRGPRRSACRRYISNERIDELYELALSKGALGGKLTGAGGGGYILLFCDFTKKHRLIEALEFAGASVTEFAFDSKGLTTWSA